jgi:hypothetical protein
VILTSQRVILAVLLGFVVQGCGDEAGTGDDKQAAGATAFSSGSGAPIASSCQNSPPPSFCKGGAAAVISNGTGADGCPLWACKQPWIVIDDLATAADKAIATKLRTFLTGLPGNPYVFALKKASQVTRQDLAGRVTTLVYDGKGLIINSGFDYGIVIHDHPFAGSPDKCAITTYLTEVNQPSLFVIQRASSEVSYDDLRKEMYNGCKQAGDRWFVQVTTRYNVCCRGLEFVPVATVPSPGVCAVAGDLLGCSDCGNGVCESWENSCTCPADCPR